MSYYIEKEYFEFVLNAKIKMNSDGNLPSEKDHKYGKCSNTF